MISVKLLFFTALWTTALADYSRDCKYGTFLSDVLLENCVRKELNLTLQRENVALGNSSQLSEYSELWARCAETTLDVKCDLLRKDTFVSKKRIRLQLLKMWNNMDSVIFAWDEMRNDKLVNEVCKKSLKTDVGRTCIPIITSYTSGDGDLKMLDNFANCVELQLKLCDDEIKAFFLDVIRKNVKFRIALTDANNEVVKECIEMMDKMKMETCSPGLHGLLEDLIFERIIIQKKIKMQFEQKCVFEELKTCSPVGVAIITDVSKTFLNISLQNVNETIMHRNSMPQPFMLMPEDRMEISKCLAATEENEVEECLPGLYQALRAIVHGDPLKTSVLRFEKKETGCLGTAFNMCSGSMRYVIHNVYYGLYKIKLDIPFDKNSLLSPPGQYEDILMEILYPPYNLPGQALTDVTKCILYTLNTLEKCCGDLVDSIFMILKDKTLPFPLTDRRYCSETCYKDDLVSCSNSEKIFLAKLIYSVKLAYLKLGKFGVSSLSPSPPYNIPDQAMKNIDVCIQTADLQSMDQLCPGLFEIISAVKNNESLPHIHLSPISCNYENLRKATGDCNEMSALYLHLFVSFLFRMYEETPSSLELFYKSKAQDNSSLSSLSYDKKQEESIATCLRTHEKEINACCPSVFSTIAVAVLNIPTNADSSELKWCARFCYEPFVFFCDSPEMMLHLINTVIKKDKPLYKTVDQLLLLPPFPPYNLPEYVWKPIDLCMTMLRFDFEKCCASVFSAVLYVLNDKPWNTQNTMFKSCSYECYQTIVKKCHPEGGDLTLSLMMHITHYNLIHSAVDHCLKGASKSFIQCCPGVLEAIMAAHKGRTWSLSEKDLENCNILCVVEHLHANCSRVDVDIVQKVMKYIFDYTQKNTTFLNKLEFNFTAKAITSIDKCFNLMQPILDECCPAMKASVYTILNSDDWPVDGPNLKICNYFCYQSAVKRCSPESVELVSNLMNHAVSKPAVGYDEFREICKQIIAKALGCCDGLVLKLVEKSNNIKLNLFKSRECRTVCKEKIINDCLRLYGKSKYLRSLIEAYFDSSNANISEAAMNTLMHKSNKRHFEETYDRNLLVNNAVNTDNIPLKKFSFAKTVFIPPLLRDKTRACIYLLKKETVFKCWPGFYELILFLINGIKYYSPYHLSIEKTNLCLQDAFQVCPIESRLIANSLIQEYLNPFVHIIPENDEIKNRVNADEQEKQMVSSCLEEIDSDEMEQCEKGLFEVLQGILMTNNSVNEMKVVPENKVCLGNVFSICTVHARLEVMKIIYEYQGAVLQIPLVVGTSHVDIINLITENEKRLVFECLAGVEEKEVDSCVPALYRVLSGKHVGLFEIPDIKQNEEKKCLGKVFSQCTTYTRSIIADLIRFATGTTVDIPYYRMQNSQPILEEERELILPCITKLDKGLLANCTPELYDVLGEISQNKIPSTKDFPIRILFSNCLQDSFLQCSAEARLILTELIHRYMNTFVSLLFAVSESRKVEESMVPILKECVSTVESSLLDNCIIGLRKALEMITGGSFPSPDFTFKLNSEAEPTCPKELFSSCSIYHRILIDELIRKIPVKLTNTAIFEIFQPALFDTGIHEYSSLDLQIINNCFSTLDKKSLENCVPGLYDSINMLIDSNLSFMGFSLKPIDRWCLSLNFVHCSYKSRILIKNLLYDFGRLIVDLPVKKSPEGMSGEMGPPFDVIKSCISSSDSQLVNECLPETDNFLYEVFVKNKHIIPKLPVGKESIVMDCLSNAIKCDIEVIAFILKTIASLNNFNFTMKINEPMVDKSENSLQINFSILSSSTDVTSPEIAVLTSPSSSPSY